MIDDRGSSKRWRRLVVVFSTLLLAGSTLLILGVTGWAQEQPAETTAQPAQQETQGLTIDYWEPQVGTTNVYFANDINDIHGQYWGALWLGYIDILDHYRDYIPAPPQVLNPYYRHVDAISNMNPVYFDMTGPWYFWMTTPYKVREEVIGIHEAPDAAKFPEASYAKRTIIIGSGGVRIHCITTYLSNYPEQKEWLEWGFTMEWFPNGSTTMRKDIVHYRDPHNRGVSIPAKTTFPLSVGSTGSQSAVFMEGGVLNMSSNSFTYTVVAEGEMTVPAGTFDTLMIRYDIQDQQERKDDPQIGYTWVGQNIGAITDITSLPNEIGPTFKEATDIYVLESSTAAGGS